jgi:hypothetical protein
MTQHLVESNELICYSVVEHGRIPRVPLMVIEPISNEFKDDIKASSVTSEENDIS